MHESAPDSRRSRDPKPQASRFSEFTEEELLLMGDALDPKASLTSLGLHFEINRDLRRLHHEQETHDH